MFCKIPNKCQLWSSSSESCKSQVFNFTKNRLRLVVPHGNFENLQNSHFWTPAANYFHHYVMPWSFLLVTRVTFRWRHWEMASDCLFNNIPSGSSNISNFSCKHKLHLFELGFYDLYPPFILQDIRG